MLLDKKKVGLATKIGAVAVALTFIISYIPMVTDVFRSNGGQTPQQQPQAMASISSLEQTTQQNPKDTKAWIQLGDAYRDQRIYDKAIESYSKALELNPKNVDVRIDRATSYFYMGQIDTATAEAQKGLEIDANNANAYYKLAIFLSSQGELEKAVEAYENHIRLNPDSASAQQAKEQIKNLEKVMESATSVK